MVLGALAVSTQRIGLIATASTTYMEPFNLARHFASLDHMSHGRAAWNIVTSWAPAAATQLRRWHASRATPSATSGPRSSWPSSRRCGTAGPTMPCSTTGPAATMRAPTASGAINHKGPHYSVAGPMNLPRGPQGRPVLVQAGSSDAGRAFAARHAEAVFTAHMEKATAQAFYADLKARVAAAGRHPGSGPDPAGALADDRVDGSRGQAACTRAQ